jgi:hypothetical protein
MHQPRNKDAITAQQGAPLPDRENVRRSPKGWSFTKLFSGSGNNPPNKTRTIIEKTPNKTKRWTGARQALDKDWTRLNKSAVFSFSCYKIGATKENTYVYDGAVKRKLASGVRSCKTHALSGGDAS